MKNIKYSRISVVNILLILTTLVLSTTTHADNGADTYYVLNPRLSNSTLEVVSLSNDNIIVAGNTALRLNRNESGTIPGVDLVAGTRITGTGAFSAGSPASATDSPVPASFAGTRFILPQFRATHFYHLLSPQGNATVKIRLGNRLKTVRLIQGQVKTETDPTEADGSPAINVNRGSVIIESDRPILIAHEAQRATPVSFLDVYPVPPASRELWGVQSGRVYIGALEDATTLKVYADDGDQVTYKLNAGERQRVLLNRTKNSSQGAGSALHIVSDKPIAAIQIADADGREATAFLPRALLATNYGIATSTQYIAITCTRPNTLVRLRQIGKAEQIRLCNGNEKLPGKVLFGSSTLSGAQIVAGSVIQANAPIYAIVEDSTNNAERNVFGLLDEASAYYVLNPRLSNGELHVISLVNNNTIQAGDTVLSLDKHEAGVIPAIDLSQGTRISGTGPFSAGSEVDGTDTPSPASLVGTRFVIPHTRSLHSFELLSPHGDANVQIRKNSTDTQNITLLQGDVQSVSAGASSRFTSTIITSDLPILVLHRGGESIVSKNYAYPVPPAARTLWGIRSGTAILGVLEDNTNITVYASNAAPITYSLNAGNTQAIGAPASAGSSRQGQGASLHIVADKPIAAIQVADGDGLEMSAFLSDAYLANHFSIPLDSQYIAIACSQPNTLIRLRNNAGISEERLCNANGATPGKAYFGSPVNGVNIPAGSVIESSQPVYLITETSASNDEHNLFGQAGNIEAFDANAYYIVNPAVRQNSLSVVSLSDNNTLSAGNTQLTLDINQSGVIPGSDLAPGTRLAGTGAFTAASAANGTDSPVPATLAGTRFAIPHIRGTHTYHMLSPYNDAVVNIRAGASGSRTITLAQGQVQSIPTGAENTVSAIIRSDVPILVVHDNFRSDVYPVLPATTELWGVQTRNVWVGAVENNTGITVYNSAAGTRAQTYTLNAGERLQLNPNPGSPGRQGEGEALHIIADKPIAAVQSADGDGTEATAFLDREHLSTHIGIPVNSQYIAITCTEIDTLVRLSSGDDILEQSCSASSDGVIPDKVYFGSTTNGINIAAGAIIESSKPIYSILESSATNDEHNLFGRSGNDFALLPDTSPQPDGYTDPGTPLALQSGRAARTVNTLGMFTLTNRNGLTVPGSGVPGSGSSIAGSDDEWNETAVRHVLRTFAFGGLGVQDTQITQWAAMSPQDAIKEILNFDESNPCSG